MTRIRGRLPLEANAALRSIVRRDTEESHEPFLQALARASGMATPTRADPARLDRKRPKKGSNADGVHPHDWEAQITKLKDGRTHLAHKLEQAVDMNGEPGKRLFVHVAGFNLGILMRRMIGTATPKEYAAPLRALLAAFARLAAAVSRRSHGVLPC